MLLELKDLADCFVGQAATNDGLSSEQRKRLTIAVELVANPSVLFLDEPTSGLDAKAAEIVMRVVSKVAATGRTVICTIHQPSAQIFGMFDKLLLLKRGGRTCYMGDVSRIRTFFQKLPNTPPFLHGTPAKSPLNHF